jgi:hypothetical protein
LFSLNHLTLPVWRKRLPPFKAKDPPVALAIVWVSVTASGASVSWCVHCWTNPWLEDVNCITPQPGTSRNDAAERAFRRFHSPSTDIRRCRRAGSGNRVLQSRHDAAQSSTPPPRYQADSQWFTPAADDSRRFLHGIEIALCALRYVYEGAPCPSSGKEHR